MHLLTDVQNYFPISNFHPYQEEIIEQILSGRDVLASIPTGGGKSLCYQYPAMKLSGITLVISPLIALMQDQVAHMRELGIPVACLNSDMSEKERKDVLLDTVRGKYKLLYVSPERLISPKFIRFAMKVQVSLVVIDESHCISLWGYDFRPVYLKIPRFFQMTGNRPPVAAFTATATEYVKKDIVQLLHMNDPFIINGGYRRTNLNLSVKHINSTTGKYLSIYAFLKSHKDQSGIIYCASVEHVLQVYEHLKRNRYRVSYYYADLEEKKKQKHFNLFMTGESCIMVSTNAFGMGIDKSDIRYVIHFDMSKDIEGYYQEIGRAGRDGKQSDCILYYTPSDIGIFQAMIQMQFQELPYENRMKGLIRQQAENRLMFMKNYAESGNTASSQELMDKIEDYFLNSERTTMLSEDILKIQEQFIKRLQQIDVLFTNETKVCKVIRNGYYQCGVSNTIQVTGNYEHKKTVIFQLDQKLDYFDIMVADAVYTLLVWGKTKIYPKNILTLLSGDPDAVMKPANYANNHSDKRRHIEESLEKMMDTKIEIDRSHSKIGFSFPDEDDCLILDGSFLPLRKEGKNGYRILETPPLYRYAELTNGQFFTIPCNLLCVTADGKKFPNSIENLKLKHFLARRLLLSKPSRSKISGKPMSRVIRFVHENPHRNGMFKILSIAFDDDVYLKKRKWNLIANKVINILEYYKSRNQITAYSIIKKYSEIGKDSIVGIELQYYSVQNKKERFC